MQTVTLAEDVAELGELIVSVPVAKLLYSAALLVLVGLLLYVAVGMLREVRRVWFDKQTYLVDFNYDENGAAQPAKGQALTNRFRSHLAELDQLFVRKHPQPAEKEMAGGLEAKPFVIEERLAFAKEESPLAGLQFNWQGIDFTGLADRLRKWAWRPETLSATISGSPHGTDALLKWSSAPPVPQDLPGGKEGFFTVRGRQDGERAVFDLACRVFWLNAARANESFRQVDPDAFCEWGWLDLQYRVLERRARRTAAGLSEDEVKKLKALRDDAGRLVELDRDFPLALQLRADVIALLPEDSKTDTDRATAVADREAFTRITQSEAIAIADIDVSTTPTTLEVPAGGGGVRKTLPFLADLDALQRSGQLAPGVALIAEGETVPFVTAGPIVEDQTGQFYLVLPDYAAQVARRSTAEPKPIGIRLMTGELVGHLAAGTQSLQAGPLALVKLVPDLRFTNRIPVAGGTEFVIGEAVEPTLDDEVHLLHSGFFVSSRKPESARRSGRVVGLELPPAAAGSVAGQAFLVAPPITGPGQGGAPAVNSAGKLVGIAYAGSADRDIIVKIAPWLKTEKLAVASR